MFNTPKVVAHWLVLGALFVLLMVVVGGITRLTHSGLSMVTWKPVTGIIPPISEQDWLTEFDEYKSSPEYIKRNFDFTLSDFKGIYFWEYIHRLLGRLLGLLFVVPFVIFFFKGYLGRKGLLRKLLFVFLLGGLQGLIGWYMVKSGLVDRPDVSHFRLALHLCTALFLVSYLWWVAMSVYFPNHSSGQVKLGRILNIILVLLGLQIIYGGFVAGLKAGLYHTTYPKMTNDWVPASILEGLGSNGLGHLVNDPVAVQFIHRWLALVVVILIIWYVVKRMQGATIIQKRAAWWLIGMVVLQFVLGVLTLVNAVPVGLGVLHQFGAALLLLLTLTNVYFDKSRG